MVCTNIFVITFSKKAWVHFFFFRQLNAFSYYYIKVTI